jgi:hypothetical protein
MRYGSADLCEEAHLIRAVSALALLASLAAFIVFVGGGLFLLAVESSGERGAGALLAAGGAIAFAMALMLIFARRDAFGSAWRIAAIIAALVAMLPVAALSVAALRFAGLPAGSRTPLLDWPVFGAGLLLGLGALAILLLAYLRVRARREPRYVVEAAPKDIPPPRPAAWVEAPPIDFDAEDEVRVTPVRRATVARLRR